jgi:hypothetical protein
MRFVVQSLDLRETGDDCIELMSIWQFLRCPDHKCNYVSENYNNPDKESDREQASEGSSSDPSLHKRFLCIQESRKLSPWPTSKF